VVELGRFAAFLAASFFAVFGVFFLTAGLRGVAFLAAGFAGVAFRVAAVRVVVFRVADFGIALFVAAFRAADLGVDFLLAAFRAADLGVDFLLAAFRAAVFRPTGAPPDCLDSLPDAPFRRTAPPPLAGFLARLTPASLLAAPDSPPTTLPLRRDEPVAPTTRVPVLPAPAFTIASPPSAFGKSSVRNTNSQGASVNTFRGQILQFFKQILVANLPVAARHFSGFASIRRPAFRTLRAAREFAPGRRQAVGSQPGSFTPVQWEAKHEKRHEFRACAADGRRGSSRALPHGAPGACRAGRGPAVSRALRALRSACAGQP